IDSMSGEFTIPTIILHKTNETSVLRRVGFKIHFIADRFFISITTNTALYNRLSLPKLVGQFNFSTKYFIQHNRALIFIDKNGKRSWESGFIKGIENDVKVELPSIFNGTINVESSRVIPRLP